LRGAMPVRGDRSSSPFSAGNRACWHVFCCVAEMFFSLSFYDFILLLFSSQVDPETNFWGAKVHINFQMTKFYTTFTTNFYAFFYFLRTFAPENGFFAPF
jgi:hypothetical protein